MPSIELANLHQPAMYWAPGGADDHGDQVRGATSVQINTRWEDKQGEMLDPNGQKITVDAQVAVDRAVSIGGWLWKGSAATTSVHTSDWMQIVALSRSDDLKGRNIRRVAGLRRYGDAAPPTS